MNNENHFENTAESSQSVGYASIPPIIPQSPKNDRSNNIPAEKRDMVYAVLLAVFSIFAVNCLFWGGAGIGVTLFACAMYITTFVYIFKTRKHFSIYTAAAGILFTALSVSLTFSDTGFGKFLAVITMIVLYTVTLMDMTALRRHLPGSFRAIGDFFSNAVSYPLDNMGKSMWALFHRSEGDGKIVRRKTGGILAGIACAIPVLFIVIPLLVASDAAFQGLLRKLNINMGTEIFGTVFVGIIVFILLFSQAFSSRYAKNTVKVKAPEHSVDPTAVCSFMCVVSFVYLLYLFSQLAYFFNAFSGILQKGFTMAEYARRGFFEMCAICFVNLIIVLVSVHISRKNEGKTALNVKIPALFICVFSLVLIATAISKMVMYINNCGMTHLRIFTSLFMIFLAVVFVSIILHLFIKSVPYMQIAFITASLLIAAAVFADIDRVVASYNINAYLDKRLDTVDTYTIGSLNSDAVVPYLFKLAECSDAEVSEDAKGILRGYFEKFFDIKENEYGEWELTDDPVNSEYDFRGFNIPEYRARKLLLEKMHFLYDGYTSISERY